MCILDPPLNIIPYIFNLIHIWAVSWPWKHLQTIFCTPLLDNVGSVAGSIILFEYGILLSKQMLQEWQSTILQNFNVVLPIDVASDFVKISFTILCEAAPYHNTSTSMLHTYKTKPALIRENHIVPVLIFMVACPKQSLLAWSSCKKGFIFSPAVLQPSSL